MPFPTPAIGQAPQRWGGQNRRRQQRPLTFRDRRNRGTGRAGPSRMQGVAGMIGSPSRPFQRQGGGGGVPQLMEMLQQMQRGGGRRVAPGGPMQGRSPYGGGGMAPMSGPRGGGRQQPTMGPNPLTAMLNRRGGGMGMTAGGRGMPAGGGVDMNQILQMIQRMQGGGGGRMMPRRGF